VLSLFKTVRVPHPAGVSDIKVDISIPLDSPIFDGPDGEDGVVDNFVNQVH